LHKQPAAVRGEGEALWGESDGEAHDFLVADAVQHGDGAVGFESDVEVAAPGVEQGGAGDAGIIKIHSGSRHLGLGGEIDPAGDGTHALIVVEGEAVAQHAALDVILLGGDPGGEAIGREGGGAEVVRQAAGGGGGIGFRADAQQEGAFEGHGGAIDDDDLTAATAGVEGGGVFSRDRWGDEAADIDAAAVATHRHMAGVLADLAAGDEGPGGGVAFVQQAAAFQRDVGGGAVWGESDAKGP
jgi:hypothetical protein